MRVAVGVAFSMAWDGRGRGDRGEDGVAVRALAGFREGLYGCLGLRRDALFCLCDAVLCAGGRVTDLARLSLVPELGRGHGALYDALNAGSADFGRLRALVAGLPLPSWGDGRIRLAVDVSNWLRPEAGTSPGRALCHVHGRGRNAGQVIPGWPYSVVAALGPGPSSWAVLLDAVRLGPGDDDCEVTAAQLRDVLARLEKAGHWRPGDPEVIIAMDAGYAVTRLELLLRGLPVILVARVRSDRVYYRPPAPRPRGTRGMAPRLGEPVKCAEPATQHDPDLEQEGRMAGTGAVSVAAWTTLRVKVSRATAGLADWPEGRPFPAVTGTLIRVSARREPMWLWSTAAGAGDGLVRACWQAYLRRFDIEHLFRFLKQRLGWTRPLLRDPEAADRWTWLLAAALAQLWLARRLAAVTRMPWQPRQAPGEMTPGRVHDGFRRARQITGSPASPPPMTVPGPGRPKGSKNKRPAPRYPVGKTRPKDPRYAANRTNEQKSQKTPGKRGRPPTTSRLNGKWGHPSSKSFRPADRCRPSTPACLAGFSDSNFRGCGHCSHLSAPTRPETTLKCSLLRHNRRQPSNAG